MGLDVASLKRRDVEALAILKLVEEIGLGAAAAHALLAKVDEGWMRRFISAVPQAIGSEPLSIEVLLRARLHRARSRHLLGTAHGGGHHR
jgi:hypothetical protein